MAFSETILLTGFPGFIAGKLLERLARPGYQFFVLVQEAFVEKATRDIERIAAKTNTPLENFAIVRGDITQPNLGMSIDDLTEVCAETTAIFHLAAVYDLAVARDLAFSVNVQGTKNVNELARAIPGLKRYNYISTCYVAGRRTGLIRENELVHTAGFRNFYEETKHLAEAEVEALKSELPVTVFRPSVVVGDSHSGETAKYDGIYYLIKYMLMAPGLLRLVNVGNNDVRLNLVPVDFVVDAIAALASDERAVGKTIHVADPNPMTTAGLFNEIAKSLTGKGALVTPPAALVHGFLRSPISPPLTGLPHFGVPYFFLSQLYDTSVATELLARHGISCPPFSSYVGNLLDFVKKNPSL